MHCEIGLLFTLKASPAVRPLECGLVVVPQETSRWEQSPILLYRVFTPGHDKIKWCAGWILFPFGLLTECVTKKRKERKLAYKMFSFSQDGVSKANVIPICYLVSGVAPFLFSSFLSTPLSFSVIKSESRHVDI